MSLQFQYATFSSTVTSWSFAPNIEIFWIRKWHVSMDTMNNDGTCWRWVGNGTRIKFAWQTTKKQTTHLILALTCFLFFSRLISFWFRFLLTVNKYHQFFHITYLWIKKIEDVNKISLQVRTERKAECLDESAKVMYQMKQARSSAFRWIEFWKSYLSSSIWILPARNVFGWFALYFRW